MGEGGTTTTAVGAAIGTGTGSECVMAVCGGTAMPGILGKVIPIGVNSGDAGATAAAAFVPDNEPEVIGNAGSVTGCGDSAGFSPSSEVRCSSETCGLLVAPFAGEAERTEENEEAAEASELKEGTGSRDREVGDAVVKAGKTGAGRKGFPGSGKKWREEVAVGIGDRVEPANGGVAFGGNGKWDADADASSACLAPSWSRVSSTPESDASGDVDVWLFVVVVGV